MLLSELLEELAEVLFTEGDIEIIDYYVEFKPLAPVIQLVRNEENKNDKI